MKTFVSLLFVLLLGGLAVADAMYVEGWPPTPVNIVPIDTPGVVKQSAKNPIDILTDAKLKAVKHSQTTLLQQVVTNGETIEQFNIFDGDTPAGSIAWYEGLAVNDGYAAMKESLFTSFSNEVTGLQDITTREPGQPTINKLQFKDPKIAEGTIILMRVRQRFYEIHIEDEFELDIKGVIEELSL